MALEFGIFDHVDRNDLPLAQFYEDRLKLIEAYDRAGIHGYHCAEHHSTPLGMSPSPSVYLAAIAARTKRLRFGPLVYTLALYHPLRLAEEICMLDQMSRGRLMVGVGKGISPHRDRLLRRRFEKADKIFAEAMSVIRQALTQKTVDFEGEFFRYKNVPMELEPVPAAAPAAVVRRHHPRQRRARGAGGHEHRRQQPGQGVPRHRRPLPRGVQGARRGGAAPKLGLNRFMCLADTEAEAVEVARRAYRRWWASFMALWNKHGIPPTMSYPAEIDGQIADDRAIVGTPAKAIELLRAEIAESGSQLSRLPLRLWRHDARGIAALARSVPAPRHAGAARERAGGGGIGPLKIMTDVKMVVIGWRIAHDRPQIRSVLVSCPADDRSRHPISARPRRVRQHAASRQVVGRAFIWQTDTGAEISRSQIRHAGTDET